MAVDTQRSAVILVLVVGVLATAPTTQAQSVDTGLMRSLGACQKVVRKHLLMAESSIAGAVRQLADTNSTIESYVRGWGERVVAGQPTAAEREEAERRIRECRLKYLQTAADVSAAMEAKLRNAVDGHVLWYDDKIFSLLTDVMSEEAQDGLVQNVKDYLEPTLKQFDNQIVSSIRESTKAIKPAYRIVSTCVRELALRGD